MVKYKLNILTENECYKNYNYKFKPRGLMAHSVGVNQPRAEVFARSWNVWRPGGRRICVHGFIDPDIFIQTLPFDTRGWHCAGTGNDTLIGIEICEPSTIKYTGVSANYEDLDPKATNDYVHRAFDTAAKVFAVLCNKFGFDPYKDIITHYMGGKTGIASGHVDPEHIWKNYGLTLDMFKDKVNEYMTYIGKDLERMDETLGANGYVPNVPPAVETPKDELFIATATPFTSYANAYKFVQECGKLGYYGININQFNIPGKDSVFQCSFTTAYTENEVDIIFKKIIDSDMDCIDNVELSATPINFNVSNDDSDDDNDQEPATFKVDDVVELRPGATTYNGKPISSWVFTHQWIIESINGNRAVINYDTEKKFQIMTAINTSELIRISTKV